MKALLKKYTIVLLLVILSSCKHEPWNSPYSDISTKNILIDSFSASPKTLDPAKAYSSDSYTFINQIYEPPLQYNYLAKPAKLESLATEMPRVRFYDSNHKQLSMHDYDKIKFTEYDIYVKPNQYYQPHPAFAKNNDNIYLYHRLSEADVSQHKTIYDFAKTGSREIVAADFIYAIKRLASPKVNSPIYSIMASHIQGLQQLRQQLQPSIAKKGYLHLDNYDISGVELIDKYHFKVTILGNYPQFRYWLAMPFFAPIPWEADLFYSQSGMEKNNLSFDWFPVGSGPFLLSKNDPNNLMQLDRNPLFHGEKFPTVTPQNINYNKFKALSSKQLPLLDGMYFYLEKENIPYWYKFLQGYYDKSTISSDNFDQAVQISPNGEMELTENMQDAGLNLQTSVMPSIYYLGFNMHSKKVGDNDPKNKFLRQAISIAIDYEEFINIFLNGRGVVAQSIIPPGIFGSITKGEYNPYIYNKKENTISRKTITEAKQLLAEAGYPNGRSLTDGKPLIIYYDVVGSGPSSSAQEQWYRKQLKKLGINLHVRNTSWNRFQEKLRTGDVELYSLGWNADYPDPENFLFLLYGPNSKLYYQGENASNFNNTEFNKLFLQMRDLPNNDERQTIIKKMVAITQDESPWVWGFFPKSYVLSHAWNGPSIINPVVNNSLKYLSVDAAARHNYQMQHNKANKVALLVILFLFLVLPALVFWLYRRSINKSKIKRV